MPWSGSLEELNRMAVWRNGGKAERQNGRTIEWQNDGMTGTYVSMAEWKNGLENKQSNYL